MGSNPREPVFSRPRGPSCAPPINRRRTRQSRSDRGSRSTDRGDPGRVNGVLRCTRGTGRGGGRSGDRTHAIPDLAIAASASAHSPVGRPPIFPPSPPVAAERCWSGKRRATPEVQRELARRGARGLDVEDGREQRTERERELGAHAVAASDLDRPLDPDLGEHARLVELPVLRRPRAGRRFRSPCTRGRSARVRAPTRRRDRAPSGA